MSLLCTAVGIAGIEEEKLTLPDGKRFPPADETTGAAIHQSHHVIGMEMGREGLGETVKG